MDVNDGANTEQVASPNEGNQDQQVTDTQQNAATEEQNSEVTSYFAELPEDTRTWLEKRGVKDPVSAAKLAYEQEKLLGNAIRVPGKDAKPEEVEAFLNKLGRPENVDGYEFKPPAELPEDLPYDGERAKTFASVAHKAGLTKAQAAAIHDWFVGETVNDYKGLAEQGSQRAAETAKTETEKLVKLWGPLDGQQMKTNLSFADRALRETGGDEVLAEFQRVGLIGTEGNMILSAPIAVMMSKIGAALYKEDDVLRGDPGRLNNPFEEGAGHNITAQMQMIRQDEGLARSYIAAAGKKPEDFGLKSK